jgi:cell wall-associated NlpC family hydrolase
VRRLLLLALFACLLAAQSATVGATASQSRRSWAQPEIKLVVAHGLMANSIAAFRPNDVLTQGELRDLVAGLTQDPPQAVPNPSAPVTMAQLDARLVRALGFSAEASNFYQGAAAAGLQPPARFGTEVVARLLGLRTNHPAPQDNLERLPSDPAPRAEAAYSVAHILRLTEWETQSVRDAAVAFELPVLTPWQKRVLTTAVGFIGFPYIWGGVSEHTQSSIGVQVSGGFDCSGFAWRVYKLQSYVGVPKLANVLRGRSAAAMAGEVPRRRRIKADRLAPADLLFFADAGPHAKAVQVDHMAIYLGNDWLIHSSRYGVALAPLAGWYAHRLAWGRRPLSEAGL